MKDDNNKLWQYRIKYAVAGSVETNYHYYHAHTAEQAYQFQAEMIEHRGWHITTKKIERQCPYANKWIDETDQVQELIT